MPGDGNFTATKTPDSLEDIAKEFEKRKIEILGSADLKSFQANFYEGKQLRDFLLRAQKAYSGKYDFPKQVYVAYISKLAKESPEKIPSHLKDGNSYYIIGASVSLGMMEEVASISWDDEQKQFSIILHSLVIEEEPDFNTDKGRKFRIVCFQQQ